MSILMCVMPEYCGKIQFQFRPQKKGLKLPLSTIIRLMEVSVVLHNPLDDLIKQRDAEISFRG